MQTKDFNRKAGHFKMARVLNNPQFSVRETKIILFQGDITDLDADAIVNAANSTLMGGGGVDGVIHRKGGFKILEECKHIREIEWPDGLPTGKAVITSGGKLKARYVIHTVGPIWRGGNYNESMLLAEAYRNCLALATTEKLETLAFPSISTGAYGYPIEKASGVALEAVKKYLEKEDGFVEVTFALFSKSDVEIYRHAANKVLGSMCNRSE